jgi:hypothetical protein
MTTDFITKDSGERIEFNSGMKRDVQKGKPMFNLIIPKFLKLEDTMLYRWAMLMTRGAEKYGERNWEKANSQEELDRFKASAFRHFIQWYCNEIDEDHAAAILFNVNCYESIKQKGGFN